MDRKRREAIERDPFGGQTLAGLSGLLVGDESFDVTGAIVPIDSDRGVYRFGDCVLSPVGLEMPDDLSFDDWKAIGDILNRLESSISWLIGDWGNRAAEMLDLWLSAEDIAELQTPDFETKYALLMARTGYAYQTVRDYAWVAASVPVSIRNRHVSFSHHRLVAKLKDDGGNPDVDEQRAWLTEAEKQGWNLSQMKAEMKARYDPPALPGRSSYSVLFEPENRPKSLRLLENTADEAIGQGNERARKRLLSQIEQWRNWLSQLESEVKIR